jgi:hypothetical protein
MGWLLDWLTPDRRTGLRTGVPFFTFGLRIDLGDVAPESATRVECAGQAG